MAKEVKKKKVNKRKKLLEELDRTWSLYVRKRDGRCLLCGGFEGEIPKLQAHHWVVSRGRSLKYRFDPRNGVALCYGCHIHQIHTNPTVDMLNKLKERAVASGVANDDDIQEILSRSVITEHISIPELESLLDKLKAGINNLPQVGGLRADPLLSRVNALDIDDL